MQFTKEISNEAKEAVSDLMLTYSDEKDRPTLYKRRASKIGDYDNENPHMFSGYAYYMLHKLGVYSKSLKLQYFDNLQVAEVVPGLHGRQAVGQNEYPEDHPQHGEFNKISRDEQDGIMIFLGTVILQADESSQTAQEILDEIITYGGINSNTWDDSKPYGGFNIRNWRSPRDVGFYKTVAGFEISLVTKIIMMLALVYTAVVTALGSKRYDGDLLAFFRLAVMKDLGFRSVLVSVGASVLRFVWIRKLGKDYLLKMFREYLKDPKHPFLTLAAELEY